MPRLLATLRRKLGLIRSSGNLTLLSSGPEPNEGYTLGGPSFVCTPEGVEVAFGPPSSWTFWGSAKDGTLPRPLFE
jgi:hypothetical protein